MNIIFKMMVVFLVAPVLFVSAAFVAMPNAVAAPLAGDTMSDTVSGMQFVWVAKGCFKPANLQTTQPAAVKQKASTVLNARSNTTSKKQLLSFDVLDDEPMSADIQHHRQTCLNHGFWMGKFEVTQVQYRQLMGKNPSSFQNGDNFPVENVRWLEARAFLRKLNAASGKIFRLPSEAEWEYAAQAGSETQHTSTNVDDVAWYLANSNGGTHAVGQKKANGFGLFDMHGNVWEWTQDCWNEDMRSAPTDGSAWLTGQCGQRVLRGGSWYDDKSMLSDKARVYNDSDSADNNSGFRIVLD